MLKKVLIILAVFFVLIGCSNIKTNTKSAGDHMNVTAAKSSKNLSLEEKINTIIDEKDKEGFTHSKDIVDYEIRGNYIFVVTYEKLRSFFVTILENDSYELKWVTTTDVGDDPVLVGAKKDGPFMFIVPAADKDAKDVTVLGHEAKLINVTKNYSESYKQEAKCWIYVTDTIGKSIKDYNPDKDIKYIK